MAEASNQIVTTTPRNTRRAALAIIIAIIIVAGLQSVADFRRETADAEHLVSATANALDYQVSRTLRMIDDLLADAAQRVNPARWPDRDQFPWFEGRLAAFPEINNALVVHADGRTAGAGLTSDGELGSVFDVTTREYFQYHITHLDDRGIHIGDPFTSRVDGKLAIPVSRAIFDRDGKFIGLIRVLLNPQFLIGGMATAVAGPVGFNAAVSVGGLILARSPDPEDFTGRSISASPAFKRILAEHRGGVGEYPSPLSGKSNIIAYRMLEHYPLLVLAGQPYWDALADWRTQLLRMLAIVGIFSVALYLVASRSDRRELVRAQLTAAAARAQMRMVQSQQQLIDALESLDDAIAVYDAENRLVAFNQAYADGFDGARHDIRAGATYHEILRAAYRWHAGTDALPDFETWSGDQRARPDLATGIPFVIREPDGRWIQERRCRTAGDGVIEIRADITALKNHEELNRKELERLVAERTVALEQEVTVRQKTEEALWASRERLKKITDSIFEAVLVFDRTGIIQFVNPSVSSQISAKTPDGGWEGHHLDDLLLLRTVNGDLRLADSPWQRVWSEGETIQDDDAEFAPLSGKAVSVAYACVPLREGGSDHPSAILSFRNTDAQKTAQRDVIQAQRLSSIGQLAAGIAHEINTPIQYVGDNLQYIGGAIDSVSHILRTLGVIPSETMDTANKIAESEAGEAMELASTLAELPVAVRDSLDGVAQITRIVRSMKEFSHPGATRKTMTDINRALESTLMITRNIWKYVATVEPHLDPSLPPVLCHAGEMNQVFLNLIVNAAHAIEASGKPPLGHISVSTAQVGNEVEISVADTGTGISPAILARIFDPFFTTKEVGKGTGQGLDICRDVVETKHGGRLVVDGRDGLGAIFTVRLPIDPGAARQLND
ncbi:MAG: hypothetical protein F8N15_07730 [Methanobacterium sp.]|nr:hypothetical protein [Methanobacterium sp.]